MTEYDSPEDPIEHWTRHFVYAFRELVKATMGEKTASSARTDTTSILPVPPPVRVEDRAGSESSKSQIGDPSFTMRPNVNPFEPDTRLPFPKDLLPNAPERVMPTPDPVKVPTIPKDLSIATDTQGRDMPAPAPLSPAERPPAEPHERPGATIPQRDMRQGFVATDPLGEVESGRITVTEMSRADPIRDGMLDYQRSRDSLEREYREAQYRITQQMMKDLGDDHCRLLNLETGFAYNRNTITDANY